MSEYKVLGHDVKEVQKKIFGIFKEFDRVCKKHGISYTLEGGTLLGAVLHHGFIPWDDDMDVIMLREEYEKFCQVAPTELQPPYVFENQHSRPEYPFLFGKCYDTSTVFLEEATQHLDIQHGVFLDIFIEDTIYPRWKWLHCHLVGAINVVRGIKLGVEHFSLRHILYAPLFLLSQQKLATLAEKVMRCFEGHKTGYVYPLSESVSSKPPLPMRMFTQFITAKFEDFDVQIPQCHMWYLHKHYETPMELPPVEKRHPGHGVVKVKL